MVLSRDCRLAPPSRSGVSIHVSVPPAASLDRSSQILSADWVRANVVAAAAAFVLALVAFVVREMLGMPDPDAGWGARVVLVAVEVVTAATAFAIYATRTGAVIRQKLREFPELTWHALHVLIGVAVGRAAAAVEMGAGPATVEPPTGPLVVSMAIRGAVAGAVLAAILGALQSLVLRKVAREVSSWIGWSVLAGTTFAAYALVLYIDADRSLGNEILTQLVSFAVAVVGGVVMLPALHRLAPR